MKFDGAVLDEASKLNLKSALKNLATRPDVQNFPAEKLLNALKRSRGLVNKAKAALMGA